MTVTDWNHGHIPEEVLKHLEVIPVETVQEVARHALDISLPGKVRPLFENAYAEAAPKH